MRLLLDTQQLIWLVEDFPQARPLRPLLGAEGAVPVFSLASIWEVAIKYGLGRADFRLAPEYLRARLADGGAEELPILADHVLAVARLPLIHRDPFDRLLIAQAMTEGITLLTADRTIGRYPGPIRTV